MFGHGALASPPKGESESAGAKPCVERTSGKAVLDKPHSAGKATGRPLPSRNAPERRQLSRTHSLPASLRPAASRRRGCSRPERRSEKWSAIFGKADSKTKRCSIGLNTIFSPMLSCRAGGIASGVSGRRQGSHAKGYPVGPATLRACAQAASGLISERCNAARSPPGVSDERRPC